MGPTRLKLVVPDGAPPLVLIARNAYGEAYPNLVAAVDTAGVATVLWPPQASPPRSGRLPEGGRASLQLRVTPGEVQVLSALSDQPLDLQALLSERAGATVEVRTIRIRPTP